MTDVTDLVAFVRACLDDDERVARAADVSAVVIVDGSGLVVMHTKTGGKTVALPSHVAAHIARHDPARVLAEVAAKRAILAHHADAIPDDPAPDHHCDGCGDIMPCPTIRLLAQPFAGRPGWREEWAT